MPALYLLLGLLPWMCVGASTSGSKITCKAGLFEIGQPASVTCNFHKNLRESKTSFYVEERFFDSNITRSVYTCNWLEDSLFCVNDDGFVLRNEDVTDHLIIDIREFAYTHAGEYRCRVIDDASQTTEQCSLLPQYVHEVLAVQLTTPTTESTSNTQEFRISFQWGLILVAVLVVLILIVIVTCVLYCKAKRANTQDVSGQVNPRSAEVEMVPIYSRPDQDVHHYLGLPPNRHAPTGDDEGGYLDLVDSDSESRPESGIYQVPGESPSPSNAPADYLHPVASAQEGPKLPKRRAPADYLHPVASAQEQPLSPSNAPADDLHPAASDQERPSSPSIAPADNLDQVASTQERPLSPSKEPADDLHPVTSAQERPSSPSNAPANNLDQVAPAQERPSSPSNAPEDNLDQVASARE